MPDGFSSTSFLLQAVQKAAESLLYFNNFFFEEGSALFLDYPNQKGTQFKFPIVYDWDSNGGTFNYDDAMPDSDSASGVFAAFTKDQWQKAVRTYNTLQAYNVGDGESIDQGDVLGTALMNDDLFVNVIKAMRAQIMSTMIADLEAQIDSSGTFSDSGLTRSVYGLASYEQTSGGDLSLDHLDDCIEALMTPTYGNAELTDLDILMPSNQFRKFSDLQSATVGTTIIGSNLPMSTDAQNPAPTDIGRLMRTKTYNGIPITVVPGMTTTNILITRKGTLKRCIWRPVETDDKTAGVMADQKLWHVKNGANVFCATPSWNAKISGLNV